MKHIILFTGFVLITGFCIAQSASDYYKQGTEEYDKKEYSKSVELFTKGIQLTPSGNLFWARGNAFWGLLNYMKAIEDYTAALAFINESAEKAKLLLNRADCGFFVAHYKDALKDYLEYLKLEPGKTYAYNQIGRCYLMLKERTLAKEAFNNAFVLSTSDKDKAVYRYNIGLSERSQLNYRAALEAFSSAIHLDTTYKSSYWARAAVYEDVKKYPQAVKDYDRLLDLAEDNYTRSSVYQARGLVYVRWNKMDEAFSDLKKAADLYPTYDGVWYDLGRFLKMNKKNNSLAEPFLQKAIDLAAIDSNSTYAYALTILGNTKKAFDFEARKIIAAQNDEYRYKWELHNMACIQALSGNKTKALDYLERSLAAGFDDFHHLVNDRDLASLTASPQYKQILSKYKVPAPKW